MDKATELLIKVRCIKVMTGLMLKRIEEAMTLTEDNIDIARLNKARKVLLNTLEICDNSEANILERFEEVKERDGVPPPPISTEEIQATDINQLARQLGEL